MAEYKTVRRNGQKPRGTVIPIGLPFCDFPLYL